MNSHGGLPDTLELPGTTATRSTIGCDANVGLRCCWRGLRQDKITEVPAAGRNIRAFRAGFRPARCAAGDRARPRRGSAPDSNATSAPGRPRRSTNGAAALATFLAERAQ